MEAKKVTHTKWVDYTGEEEKRANRESYKAAKIKAKLIVIIAKLTTFISG